MHFFLIFQHNKRRRRVKRKIQIRKRCNPLSNGYLCLIYKRNFVFNIFTCFLYICKFLRKYTCFFLSNSTHLYNCYTLEHNLHFIHIMFCCAWLCLYIYIFIRIYLVQKKYILSNRTTLHFQFSHMSYIDSRYIKLQVLLLCYNFSARLKVAIYYAYYYMGNRQAGNLNALFGEFAYTTRRE